MRPTDALRSKIRYPPERTQAAYAFRHQLGSLAEVQPWPCICRREASPRRETACSKRGVQSDEGFSLQSVARDAFEYREGERTMRLEGESIVGGLGDATFGFGFYSTWRTARWKSPHDWDDVSHVDRERIVANVKKAMLFIGGLAEFD
jgi:hypothetical protein